MVAYCLGDGSDELFDPAVGAGAFFLAAKSIAHAQNRTIKLFGAEIDSAALQQAINNGLSQRDLTNVAVKDFVLSAPTRQFPAIVANPPYVRHHRLSLAVKDELRALGLKLIGKSLDGRAGLHIYFLLRGLQSLAPGGRLAFIMPADTCEGVFAGSLWRWLTAHYCLDGVITFTHAATPFPNVDTNPLIFLIRHAKPQAQFRWAQCKQAGSKQLKNWVTAGLKQVSNVEMEVYQRDLAEGVAAGLSRPLNQQPTGEFVLADFASVMRGIATGANEFFFLTRQQAQTLKLPAAMLLRAVGRTRDVPADRITLEVLQQLETSGRPTWLFAPDGRELENFPVPVRKYLAQGQAAGLDQRSLIAQRHPWYKMEVRKAPPFLFAYLGRRNARFIRNLAGVMPLTGFLCVYPSRGDEEFSEKLWQVLQHPDTVANLALVGKTYGSGAIKVEPRALERLPLPQAVVEQAGLTPQPIQTKLFAL